MRPALCIVVPVLNEATELAARLQALAPLRQRGARLVVVDGGSQDNTLAIARAHADLALVAPRGRAEQMNAGAAACPAEVLLFLHADTALPEAADELVRQATQGALAWGPLRRANQQPTAAAASGVGPDQLAFAGGLALPRVTRRSLCATTCSAVSAASRASR